MMHFIIFISGVSIGATLGFFIWVILTVGKKGDV